jgi:parvulin-like peptidyl-prolyl isomerase
MAQSLNHSIRDIATAEQPPRSRLGLLLLTLGAVTGIAVAAAGLLGPGLTVSSALPAGAVARINGQVIRGEDYERVVAGLASDRRDGIDDSQRRLVLDRLIDEELLIQRGLELGFARQDRKVRADLTAAVIASVVTEHEDLQPSDAELQAFYDTHRDFFTQPGRLRLQQIFCRVPTPTDDPPALARAQEAARRLRGGEAFAAVHVELGDAEIAPLPDALLPPAKLVDYLGPTPLQTALNLDAGAVSDPVRSGSGYHVLRVLERQSDTTPAFADIKPQIVAEFRRSTGERALRAYLDTLRARAEVVVAPTLP